MRNSRTMTELLIDWRANAAADGAASLLEPPGRLRRERVIRRCPLALRFPPRGFAILDRISPLTRMPRQEPGSAERGEITKVVEIARLEACLPDGDVPGDRGP